MNWVAQVLHVAAKDIRHTRWLLLAYVAMICAAVASVVTGRALGAYSASLSTAGLSTDSTYAATYAATYVVCLPLCMVMLGTLLAASLLQEDSPTRATAFWATHPLAPGAVLTSKLLVVLVAIVALPLLGGVAALIWVHPSGSTLAGALTDAGVSYGAWLMAAMIVGALTDDVRAFAGVFVGILAMMLIVVASLQDVQSTAVSAATSRAALVTLKLVAFVGGAGLLSFLYHTHDRRRRVWLAGVAATILLVVVSVVEPSVGRAASPPSTVGPRLVIDAVDSPNLGRPHQLEIGLRMANDADSLRFSLRTDSLRFDTPQGSYVRDGNRVFGHDIVDRVPPPVGQPVNWIVDRFTNELTGSVRPIPDPLNDQIMARGAGSVTLHATVTSWRSRVFANIPLRAGATIVRDGRRMEIYGFTHGQSVAQLTLGTSTVRRVSDSSFPEFQLPPQFQFALVNSGRAEAMLIDQSRSASTSEAWVVLPWLGVSTASTSLATTEAPGTTSAFPRDDAWYTGAHLVVIEWIPVGRFHTSARAPLPQ